MTSTFKIVEPGTDAREIAVETRNKLSAMVDAMQAQCAAPAVQELSADCRKEFKAVGKDAFTEELGDATPTLPVLLTAYTGAVATLLNDLGSNSSDDEVREATYHMEGAANAYSRAVAGLRAQGIEPDATHERMCALSMYAPATTSGHQDEQVAEYCGAINLNGLRGMAYAGACRSGDWVFRVLNDWVGAELYPETPVYYAAPIVYYEPDGPWVAGFLNVRDMGRLRFTRQRLGAWLKASGTMTDEQIRARVEKSAETVAVASFEFLPNDISWADTYVQGKQGDGDVDSCMSHAASDYNTWDNIHPVEAYSAALYGCGDNGLVLVVAVDQHNEIQGRGIMNIRDGQKNIVRWYGSNTAERALKKLGFDTSAGFTLKESWLAFLASDEVDEDVGTSRFIHPYVDGCVVYGKVDEQARRVYLQPTRSGHKELQMTEGASWLDKVRYCEDVRAYRVESRAELRKVLDGWQTRNPEWVCPIIHEAVHESDRTWMVIDGEEVQVCEHVYYRQSEYLDRVPATEELVQEHGATTQFWTRNATETRRHNEWLLSQPNPEQQVLLPIPPSPSPASLPVSSSSDGLTAARANNLRQQSSSNASPAPVTALTPTDTAIFHAWLRRNHQNEWDFELAFQECCCPNCDVYQNNRRPGLIQAFMESRPAPNAVELATQAYFREVIQAAVSSRRTLTPFTGTMEINSSSSLTELGSWLQTAQMDGPLF